MAAPIIEIRNLQKWYSGVHALKSVSLDIYPNEALVVAIVLAFVPYLLIRGPVDRIARKWIARKASHPRLRESRPPRIGS